jgi:hypothetical protein
MRGKNNAVPVRKGDLVRIVRMDDAGGRDWQASRMNGHVGRVSFVDSAGQIHLGNAGLAVIPGVDEFEIIARAEEDGNG